MAEVLLLTASFGAGHTQVATAVGEAVGVEAPGTGTAIMDYLRFFPRPLSWSTVAIYKGLYRYWPMGYGGVYRITSGLAAFDVWRRVEFKVGMEQLQRLMDRLRPRVVVCTHPLPMGAISLMRRAGQPTPPTLAVVTDYVLHGEWVQPGLDRYLVPSQEMAEALHRRGIEGVKTQVAGIPVRRQFLTLAARVPNSARPRRLLWILSALGTVRGVRVAVRELLKENPLDHLTVVVGHDRVLFRQLAALAADFGDRLEVAGFVEDVAKRMAAADVVVTKAGAVTLTEAMALARPIVVYRPIPGQEAGNARWLETRGAVRVAREPADLAAVVRALGENPAMAREMGRRAENLARSEAARMAAITAIRLGAIGLG